MRNIVKENHCCFIDTVIYDDNGSIWGLVIIVGEIHSPTYDLIICRYNDIENYENYEYKNFNYYDETGTCDIKNYKEIIVPFNKLESYKFPKQYKIEINKQSRFIYSLITSNAKFNNYLGVTFDNLIFSKKTLKAILKLRNGDIIEIMDRDGNLNNFKFVINNQHKYLFDEFKDIKFEQSTKTGYLEGSTNGLELTTFGLEDNIVITDRELGISFVSIPFPLINFYVSESYKTKVLIKYMSLYNKLNLDLDKYDTKEQLISTEDLSNYNWCAYPSLVVAYKQLDNNKSKYLLSLCDSIYKLAKESNKNLEIQDYKVIIGNFLLNKKVPIEEVFKRYLNCELQLTNEVIRDRKISIEIERAVESLYFSIKNYKRKSVLITRLSILQRQACLSDLFVNNTRRELVSKELIDYYTQDYKLTKAKLVIYL